MLSNQRIIISSALLVSVLLLFSSLAIAGLAPIQAPGTGGSTIDTKSTEGTSGITTRVVQDAQRSRKSAEKESELRSRIRDTLPKVTERSIILRKNIEAKDTWKLQRERKDLAREVFVDRNVKNSKVEVTRVNEGAQCHSSKFNTVLAESFDCTDAIKSLDEKEVPLYTGRGKDHAAIETNFHIDEHTKYAVLSLAQTFDAPWQQRASIFWKHSEGTNGNWKGIAYNIQADSREPTIHTIDMTRYVRGRNSIAIRVEAYSPEGTMRYAVNNVALVQTGEDTENSVDQDTNVNCPKDLTGLDDGGKNGPEAVGDCLGDDDDGDGDDGEDGISGPRTNGVAPNAGFQDTPVPNSILNDASFETVQEASGGSNLLEEETQAEEVTDNANPLTGAVIGNRLFGNNPWAGLLLLLAVIAGSMIYRVSRRRRLF